MIAKASTTHMMHARLGMLAVLAVAAVCVAQTGEVAGLPTATPASSDAVSTTAAKPEIRPRLELYIPSVRGLMAEAQQSHSGVFVAPLGRLMRGVAGASAEGIDADQAAAIVKQIGHWPDTAISAFVYAPDTEGRLQWAIRFDWPIRDLHKRVETLLDTETVADLFEGIALQSTAEEGHEITLTESTLAHLLPMEDSHSCVSSHSDLPIPTEPFTGASEAEDDDAPLVACRLNLTGTEIDSGATFLSSFSAITDVVYSGCVDKDGDWAESIHVHWPPISGMGAKALFGKVKQTFFVPREAFGAAVFKAIMAPGMLDGIAGFGQQVLMEASGEMTIIGEAGIGPIASSVEPEMCVTLLPGTGFLPMPDIVVQGRTKRAKRLVARLRKAAEKTNEAYRDRDQKEPWNEITVADRTVLWSDGTNPYPGMVMPLVLRPVLFTTTEIDARERERDFLVVAWTSTSPEAFVRRWLDLPRSKDKLYLPDKRKMNGQLWVNWRQVYKWVSPYVNAPLGALVGEVLLPGTDDVASDMTDALVTVKMSYAGLSVSHKGPVPAGAVVVPALVSASTSADPSGSSDLARERLACQRLKVLYHHAKLFKKDMDRWPAEVAELDGYVDFAGHPRLLKLEVSSRKQWSKWFEGLLEKEEKEEEEEADESPFGEIDDDLYVIDWARESWRLKLAPDTLEHLEELYIDQDGKIHRKETGTRREGGRE